MAQVFIKVEGESCETHVYLVDQQVAAHLKNLLEESEDWPEEINTILDSLEEVDIYGTINTSGDGWCWY